MRFDFLYFKHLSLDQDYWNFKMILAIRLGNRIPLGHGRSNLDTAAESSVFYTTGADRVSFLAFRGLVGYFLIRFIFFFYGV